MSIIIHLHNALVSYSVYIDIRHRQRLCCDASPSDPGAGSGASAAPAEPSAEPAASLPPHNNNKRCGARRGRASTKGLYRTYPGTRPRHPRTWSGRGVASGIASGIASGWALGIAIRVGVLGVGVGEFQAASANMGPSPSSSSSKPSSSSYEGSRSAA